MRHRFEPKASQALLGCMMSFALNFKLCPPGAQGHPGKVVTQVMALQRLMDRQCLERTCQVFYHTSGVLFCRGSKVLSLNSHSPKHNWP